jgi:hypothetical protein
MWRLHHGRRTAPDARYPPVDGLGSGKAAEIGRGDRDTFPAETALAYGTVAASDCSCIGFVDSRDDDVDEQPGSADRSPVFGEMMATASLTPMMSPPPCHNRDDVQANTGQHRTTPNNTDTT